MNWQDILKDYDEESREYFQKVLEYLTAYKADLEVAFRRSQDFFTKNRQQIMGGEMEDVREFMLKANDRFTETMDDLKALANTIERQLVEADE